MKSHNYPDKVDILIFPHQTMSALIKDNSKIILKATFQLVVGLPDVRLLGQIVNMVLSVICLFTLVSYSAPVST